MGHRQGWFVFIVVLNLCLPLTPVEAEVAGGRFSWGETPLFAQLESDYFAARKLSKPEAENLLKQQLTQGRSALEQIVQSGTTVPKAALAQLGVVQFRSAAIAAAQPGYIGQVRDFIFDARVLVSRAAMKWPVNDIEVHEAIYRILYGGRAALEEALAQAGPEDVPSLYFRNSAPAPTPSAIVEGVEVHSGDILLSRGGAVTSAFIARGNPFPGQFSHAALVYVDPVSHEPLVIESLIEAGVVVTPAKEYLERTSLRVVVLRLRPDLDLLQKNPLAPHEAATYMLAAARNSHIPYDFAMNWDDSSAYFCSEVVYHAYQHVGIDLWRYKGEVVSPGLKHWLGDLGVRYFTMIIPSDIEYDPRLTEVAEWLSLDTLRQDRYDSAILDVLLEMAEDGYRLSYHWYQVPLMGVVKGWSWLQSVVGAEPKVPTGMSRGTALRAYALSEKIHPLLKEALVESARRFRQQNGYEPPYWRLREMTREIAAAHRQDLAPYLKK